MATPSELYISKNALLVRGVYWIKGRNLIHGVWTGTTFIGIRYKFEDAFLDSEDHCDDGTSISTVKPLQFEVMLPDDIELSVRDNKPLFDFLKAERCPFPEHLYQH